MIEELTTEVFLPERFDGFENRLGDADPILRTEACAADRIEKVGQRIDVFLQEHFYDFEKREVESRVKSVPAGTWNMFCTQIRLLAQLISLHLEWEADYAAG